MKIQNIFQKMIIIEDILFWDKKRPKMALSNIAKQDYNNK